MLCFEITMLLQNVWLPISDNLFYTLLIIFYFQWFLYNDEKIVQMCSVFTDFTHTQKTYV